MTPPPSIRHAELKATALLLGLLALIVAFVFYVMHARGAFEETQALTLEAENAEGVVVGMDLTFSGFPIGRVRRIELAGSGKAHIVVDVPIRDAHWLRTSSVFTLERGVVGDTRLRAYSNLPDDPPMPAGALRTAHLGDARDGIPRLVATMQALLQNLQRLSDADAPLSTSLQHVERLTAAMTGPYGALGGLLGSEQRARQVMTMLERSNTLLAKTETRLFGSTGVIDDAQRAARELGDLLAETRQRLQAVDRILADAQAVASNARVASDDLGALRADVDASLRRIRALVEAINNQWPFARERPLELP